MLIEHTLRRTGGTVVTMPVTADSPKGGRYHFKPATEDGPHVAEVTDKAHLKRFLSIDTYVPADDAEAPPDLTSRVDADSQAGETEQSVTFTEGWEVGLTEEEITDRLGQATDGTLAALHEQHVGKPPHHKAKRETIIANIVADLTSDEDDGDDEGAGDEG